MTYGLRHTKKYKPSIVTPFLDERDENGNLIKRHSDVYLILRQESLQRSIGIDALRRHFDSSRMNGNTSMSTDGLTDDQIFDLIEPKAVNNLTTAYEWANYLKEHEEELKAKRDEYVKTRSRQEEFERWFKPKNKDKSDDESKDE